MFSRVAKDKKGKATKTLLDQIDEKLEKDIAALRIKLEDKLFTLVNGKTSQGVKDYYGTEFIPKGVKLYTEAITGTGLPEYRSFKMDH